MKPTSQRAKLLALPSAQATIAVIRPMTIARSRRRGGCRRSQRGGRSARRRCARRPGTGRRRSRAAPRPRAGRRGSSRRLVSADAVAIAAHLVFSAICRRFAGACKIACSPAVPSGPATNIRSMNDQATYTDADRVRVAAPVIELDLPVCREVMTALADPADPDQAVLVNVPFLVDGLNFGDLVRLGEPDEARDPADPRGRRRQRPRPSRRRDRARRGARPRRPARADVPVLRPADHRGERQPALDQRPSRPRSGGRLRRRSRPGSAAEADDPEEGLAVGEPCATELGPMAWADAV